MYKTLGKRKLIRDISANVLQTGTSQIFGLLIFYLTSKYLAKSEFGELNWTTAIGSTLIAVASLGLDLVFVKRVASGQDVVQISGIHLFHTVIVGLVVTLGAGLIKWFMPGFSENHPLVFFVFLYLALSNVSNSFKLCLNGLEAYRELAILSLCMNLIKMGFVIFFYVIGAFTVMNVILTYTISSGAELIAGYFLMGKKIATRVKPLLKVVEYKYFIIESLPQLGVVVFDSALSRIDWILLGVLSTAAATADYSFVYKVFELSKLPLLIIAPVLLTRFSRIFTEPVNVTETHEKQIDFFFRIELVIMMILPIILCCTWEPLVDYFTDNKYGTGNLDKYLVLAICVPLVAMVNYLWTLGFVQGQLKQIFSITIVVSFLNIVLNTILIPFADGLGAALSFLVSSIVQLILYIVYIDQHHFRLNVWICTGTFLFASASVLAGFLATDNIVLRPIVALTLFTLLSVLILKLRYSTLKLLFKGNDNLSA